MRILVVEDEKAIADVISERLKCERYAVDVDYDGEDGLYDALCGIYDLIILDVMLPSKDGFEILKEIRDEKIDSKVIMLTAKSTLDDKLVGLTGGADDYVTKPFHIEELVARVNIQLRKTSDSSNVDILNVGDLTLNLKMSKIINNESQEEIEIGCKEFQLLEYFMRNPNMVISKEQIYDTVWGIDNEIESNNLEAYLSFIRKKIKIIGSKVTIRAVRGLGYKLEVDNEKSK